MRNASHLPLDRCPFCGIAQPNLAHLWETRTISPGSGEARQWTLYSCATCRGVVMTVAEINYIPPGNALIGDISEIWPPAQTIPSEMPERPRQFLRQALDSKAAPAGAVVLAAGAVDAMLKDKGYKDGSLNTRIDQAAKEHLITAEMAAWAHDVRLDANDQRHADESAPLPNDADADKVIRFAMALGQFLYVLPAMVERGRKMPTQPAQAAAERA